MVTHGATARVLLALYVAFGLPMCCCYLSTVAACCTTGSGPGSSDSEFVVAHIHDGHQHDHGGELAGDDPADEQAPDPKTPYDHDDSCSCGCDGPRSPVIEKLVSVDSPVLAVNVFGWIVQDPTAQPPIVAPLARGAYGPPMTLVRMHCALII